MLPTRTNPPQAARVAARSLKQKIDHRENGELNMAPRNYEVLKKHKEIADANVRDRFRRGLDRDALYKTDGGFVPSPAPKGSGPPYKPENMPRITPRTKAQND
jgi:hypothetical protein